MGRNQGHIFTCSKNMSRLSVILTKSLYGKRSIQRQKNLRLTQNWQKWFRPRVMRLKQFTIQQIVKKKSKAKLKDFLSSG